MDSGNGVEQGKQKLNQPLLLPGSLKIFHPGKLIEDLPKYRGFKENNKNRFKLNKTGSNNCSCIYI